MKKKIEEPAADLNGTNRISELIKAKKPEHGSPVLIRSINRQRVTIPIVGTSGLIMHAWSKKAISMMLDAQMKKAKKAREAKDPPRDFMESIYFIGKKPTDPTELLDSPEDFRYGFPSPAFKLAMVDAASQLDGVTKVFLRGAFHIEGYHVEIQGVPQMHEAMVRLATGTADVRYRALFDPWKANVPVVFNADVISVEQLTNLLNQAGFSVGIGDHRVQRDGPHGMFEVASH